MQNNRQHTFTKRSKAPGSQALHIQTKFIKVLKNSEITTTVILRRTVQVSSSPMRETKPAIAFLGTYHSMLQMGGLLP